MEYAIGPGEAAVLWRCQRAISDGDSAAFVAWNAWFRASRETAELRAETEQTGAALVKLLNDLDLLDAGALAAVSAAARRDIAGRIRLGRASLGRRCAGRR